MAGLTPHARHARRRLLAAVAAVAWLTGLAGCRREAPPARYPLHGQILAVDAAKNEITINHDDIPNYMPAMTMVYGVAPAAMKDRVAGEVIDAVIEVEKSMPRIIEVTHVGTKPLPASANQAGMAAGVLDVGDPVPDVALVDQANRRRSLSEWRGAPVVMTFVYTRCPLPNFCPLMDQNFATLQRRLADDTILRGRAKLVTFTFDPEHDTPEVLATHAAAVKADPAVWSFLTGDATTVGRLAGTFGIGILPDPQTPAQITHNLRTFLVGADGRIAKIYSGNDWTPGDVLTDLRGLVAGAR